MSALQCIVVTPEATLREGPAEFVVVPLDDGELGIAPDHAPMVGRLGFGELRITSEGQVSRYYVEGGFVEVVGGAVTVLTSRAVPAESLDAAAAKEQLLDTQSRPATTPDAMTARDKAAAQARAKLRIARRAEL